MTDERRRFFRINDTLGVSCDILTAEDIAALEEGGALSPIDNFSVIASCDMKIASCLQQLAEKDPLVSTLLEQMNKKIDFIVNQLEVESRTLRGISHKMKEVSISACGIAFIHDESLGRDSLVRLNLLLKPSGQHLQSYGKVVGCDLCKGGFYVRINFQNMDLGDQETLIQHLVQRQGVQLREERPKPG